MIYLSNLEVLLCGYSFFCNCNVWNSLLGTRPSKCLLMADNELATNSCTCTCMLEEGKWWCAFPPTLGHSSIQFFPHTNSTSLTLDLMHKICDCVVHIRIHCMPVCLPGRSLASATAIIFLFFLLSWFNVLWGLDIATIRNVNFLICKRSLKTCDRIKL